MNAAAFDSALARALGDGSGTIYAPPDRQAALLRALREYSRYRPCLRRVGTGNLVATLGSTNIPAGATTILAVGGRFLPGDTLSIDPYGYHPEMVTALDVELYGGLPSAQEEPSGMVEITLKAPGFAFAHADGSLIQRAPLGLSILQSIDTYALPPDFMIVQQDSFDLAVGAKTQPVQTNSFYDASYAISQELSGIGWGGSINFGPAPLGGYPIVGNPFFNPNGVPGATSAAQYGAMTVFRFQRQGPQPLLLISPPPTANQTWDPFLYFGGHIAGTVPETDAEPVLAYSCACARRARADAITQKLDTKIGDSSKRVSLNAKELRTLADADEKLFDIKIRKHPIFTSG